MTLDAFEIIPEEIIEGHRLGRHVFHDPRSRAYSAPRATTVQSVRHAHHGNVLDQGAIGSCTGNAIVDALMCDGLWNGSWSFTEDDALSVYEQATREDQIQGSYPPDDTGSYGLAVCQVAVERGWIPGYDHAFGLQHTLEALTLQPVIIGVNWYSGFDQPDNGIARYAGSVRGGHEVCLMGIDAERQLVMALNSWGPGFGFGGFFFWEFSTLEALLSQNGDVTVPRPPVAPPPPPPPPPAPAHVSIGVTPTTVTQGGNVTVSGAGWKGNTSVNFGVDNLPNGLIGGASSDAGGNVAPATFAIPVSVTVGQHVVIANGLDSTDRFNGTGVAVTVTGAPPSVDHRYFSSPRVVEKIFHKRSHPRVKDENDYTWYATVDQPIAAGYRRCKQCRWP